jgi:glyoxylase-like metal-dependent hydrolase (beta-lactamase superfamily II)
MAFLSEPEPERGVAIDVLPGIRRVVARNPSVMTYHGTNTYLLDWKDGITVIDPGPDDDEHVRDVVRAAGEKPITRLVVTHAHEDHHGAVKKLQAATGAPSWGYQTSGMNWEFKAEHGLKDGETVAGLQAVFTPGHAQDHLSFAYQVTDIGQILFSGDHVMAWSSSIVNPPQGDMRAYYNALELLLLRADQIYLPGHGPMARDPKALVTALLQHRQMREASILSALEDGPLSVREIAAQLYAKTDESLKFAAERNVLAHLLKLQEEGRAIALGDQPRSRFSEIRMTEDDRELLTAAYLEMAVQDAKRQFKRA